MIPSAFVIPTVTMPAGMAATFGPAIVLGLTAVLVALGVLLSRLAAAGEPEVSPSTMTDHGGRLPVFVRRAA